MKHFILAACLLFQLASANPLLEYGIPYYPESTEPTSKESNVLEGAIDLGYQSKIAPDEIYGFYLKSIPDSNWNLKGMQDNSLNFEHIKTTQITLSLLTKDQKSAAQLVIFQEGTGLTGVMITYIQDITSIANAQRPKPPVEKDPEDEEVIEHSEYFPLMKPLADIKRLVNQGKYQEIHNSGSSYFKRHISVEYIKKELEPKRINELVSLYSSGSDELKTAIIKFELQSQNSTELGYRIMYFNFENGEWKFNNLPFLSAPLQAPEALRMKFE